MKLISSSPKPRHRLKAEPPRGWLLKRLRPRFFATRYIVPTAWVMLVVIVAVFTISVFHLLRQFLETAAGQ